jgi:hypothetical protein
VKRLALLCVLIACAAPASAAPSAAPPIDPTALQSYARGVGFISGSTSFPGEAVCAPDIPYVNWFVSRLNDDTLPIFDARVKPYVRVVPIQRFAFTCADLAPGRYIVWIESPVDPSNASEPLAGTDVRGPQTNIPNRITGDDGPAQYQAGYSGALPAMTERVKIRRLRVLPQHVFLETNLTGVYL